MSNEILRRTASARAVRGEDDDKRLELSFSSEDPYPRWFGREVLGHGEDEINLKRLNDSAPFLADHRNELDSILGVVEKASVEDKRGVASVRLVKGESDQAKRAGELFDLIEQGVAGKISVGYSVEKLVRDKQMEADLGLNGEDYSDRVYRATEWTPMEISLVAVPADDTVGVGKAEEFLRTRGVASDNNSHKQEGNPMSDEQKTPEAGRPDALTPEQKAQVEASAKARRDEIATYGKIHAAAGGVDLARDVNAQGGTIDDLKEKLAEASMKTYEERQKAIAEGRDVRQPDLSVGLEARDVERFSYRALAEGEINRLSGKDTKVGGFEREICQAFEEKAAGFAPSKGGRVIPPEVLGRRSVTNERLEKLLERSNFVSAAQASGDLVGTDHRGDMFVEALYNASAFMGNGIMVLDGLTENIEIPTEGTVIAAEWVDEDDNLTTRNAQFGKITLSPKEVGVTVGYGRKLFRQSDPSIDNILMRQASMGIAIAVDSAIWKGSGTNNQPRGIKETANVQNMNAYRAGTAAFKSATGAELNWPALVNFETLLANENLDTSSMRYIVNSATVGKLKTTEKASGYPVYLIEGGMINGYPFIRSNQLARNLRSGSASSGVMNTSEMAAGIMSEALLAQWGGLELVVDPYTSSKQGVVNLVWHRSVDVGVLRPNAFVFIERGVLTA